MSEHLPIDELTEEEQNQALQCETVLYGPDVSGQATENPAVARCCAAFTRAFVATFAGDPDSEVHARLDGEKAYRQAMPPLTGSRNLRDFIACVAHGLLVEAIDISRGAKLLYAAQVAHTLRRAKSKTLKNTSSTN